MTGPSERIGEIAARSRGDASALVDVILREALELAASDIHIDPLGETTRISMRVDGLLRDVVEIPADVTVYLMGRLKVVSGLLSHRTNVPQEGRIAWERDGRTVDLRTSIFPTVRGERAVVRVFDSVYKAFGLDELGFSAEVTQVLRAALGGREGMILMTGPAGSGKTTTAYASIEEMALGGATRRSIVTVEDPVERVIGGVVQVEVKPASGLTFASCLAHLLRQDPEVIVVGEIRDAETAAIAVQAGLTGHLVLSTLHCPSAASAFVRLLDMGIEPYLLASAVRLVVNQRLVRRLCSKCRRWEGGEWTAVGCNACGETGYSGRTAVAEMVRMNDAVRRVVLSRGDRNALEEAAADQAAGRRISDTIETLCREGVTTVQEGIRVAGDGRCL